MQGQAAMTCSVMVEQAKPMRVAALQVLNTDLFWVFLSSQQLPSLGMATAVSRGRSSGPS